jgi:S-DNA-T family DNA segregation ATPase FtsK/SpoIIIE
MSRETFTPAARRDSIPRVPANAAKLEPAPPVELDARKSVFERLMPLAMISGMGLMFGVMFLMRSQGASAGASVGAGAGVGAMMPMMMMLPMMLGRFMGGQQSGGKSEAEVDKERKENTATIAEARRVVHGIGDAQQTVAVRTFPNPEAMPLLVRSRHDTLWSVTPERSEQERKDLSDNPDYPRSYPELTARIGVGIQTLNPVIDVGEESENQETREPVIASQNYQFALIQGLVTECPIGLYLENPAYHIIGADEDRRELARTMLLSLVYASGPENISVGVVADDTTRDHWDWVKWLPHNQNQFTPADTRTRHGMTPMFWPDMKTATRDLLHYRREAGDTHEIILIVDLPGQPVGYDRSQFSNPDDMAARVFNADQTTMGLEDITALVVSGHPDDMVDPTCRLKVVDGTVKFFTLTSPVRADHTSIETAEDTALELAAITTAGHGLSRTTETDTSAPSVNNVDAPTFMESIGTNDLAHYDLQGNWRETDKKESFEVPMGFEVDPVNNDPTGKTITLDILETPAGGTGPHGLFSGKSGSGKSFLLTGLLIQLMLRFSPRRLVFVIADFKGGATALPFVGMPHVLAALTDLEGSTDLVERTEQVLYGEMARRKKLLAAWECADYLAYHAKQRAHPELDMPDLPVLLFVSDEFRAFILKNQSYKLLLESLAAEGRSFGMFLLVGSQFLEQQMLGSVLDNIHYGFTMALDNSQHSTTVIRSAAAAQSLPPSMVGYLHSTVNGKSDLQRLQGFNHALPYNPSAAPAPVRQIAQTTEAGEDLTDDVLEFRTDGSFTRAAVRGAHHTAEETDIDVVTPTTEESGAEVIDQFTAVRNMIVEKGSSYTHPTQMWATPLNVPMSLADVPADYWATTPEGTIRLGDIDVPFEHRRIPMEVNLDSSKGTVAIYGDRGTGRSTAVKTLIASSAYRHTGDRLAWFVYDYAGNSLADMDDWPNVGAYATRTDTDMWIRIRGEIDRIMSLREQVWAVRRPADPVEYFDAKKADPDPRDPYGRIVLAVDGFGEWAEWAKFNASDQYDWVKTLIKRGPQYGIHIVVTLTSTDGVRGTELADTMGQRILLKHQDHANLPVRGDMDLRNINKTMPAGQPGRVSDGSMSKTTGETDWHHGRILVPVNYTIEQTRLPEGGVGYDPDRNYSSSIRELGAIIGREHDAQAPGSRVEHLSVPTGSVTFQKLWNAVQANNPNLTGEIIDGEPLRVPAGRRKLPLGVSMSTGTPYFHDLAARQTHMMVVGDSGKGATTLLRAHMTAVMASYSPEEARMSILDGGGDLADIFHRAAERGYTKNSSYAMNKSRMDDIIARLEQVITRQTPDEDMLLNDPSLRETREYVTGPEMFVYIDKFPKFASRMGQGGLENLMTLMSSGIDVGVHFIVTETASAFSQDTGISKFIKPLVEDLPTSAVLLSSGAPGRVVHGVRHEVVPTGRARFVDESGVATHVQIANVGSGK